ncbi:MAG: VTT domain-containing protein, partial [Desulfarculus sp.]|nr:VTT domain-containing protein [Desulfarculus sp.]
LAARHFARKSVEAWLAGNHRFQRLDAMVQRQGAVVVAITRLVPLFPFNLLNFGFGLTRVPFGTYLLYSWLCMLPGTVLYVVGFDALFTGLAQGRVPWALVAVAAAMAMLLTLLIRRARRRLGPENDPAQNQPTTPGSQP